MTDFEEKEMEGFFRSSHEWCLIRQAILGLQPRDKAAMLARGQHNRILQESTGYFPEERNAFVLDHQHGHHYVTCKTAILSLHLITAPQEACR